MSKAIREFEAALRFAKMLEDVPGDLPAEIGPEPSESEIRGMTKHASNSWGKLKDGSWGVYVEGAAVPGSSVLVHKRDGSSSTVVLGRRIWQGNGKMLFAVERDAGGSHSRRRRGPGGSYECEECGDYVRPGTSCWETGMMH